MKWCVGTSNSGENQFKPIYSFKDVDTLVKSRFLKKKILMEMETRGLSKWKSESDINFFFYLYQTDAAICCNVLNRWTGDVSPLTYWDWKRNSEGGGVVEQSQREMSYLHISKIHHRTAIKGPVNTVLHIERNFSCVSESSVYVQF